MLETSPARQFSDVTAHRFSRPDLLALGLLVATLIVLCAVTWLRWGALPVDCGREMYVPFAINSGQHLYFDIWYPYGPLIPYWHAALFRVFGIHLSVLYAAGIALIVSMVFILYFIARPFLPPALSFAAVFAFLLQAFQMSLFNYVLPYSYPAAYGSVLSAALLLLLLRDIAVPSDLKLFCAGILAGTLVLTKTEFGIAGLLILAVAVLLRGLRARSVLALGRNILLVAPGVLASAAVYGVLVARSSVRFMFDDNIPILADSFFRQTTARLRGAPSLRDAVISKIESTAGMALTATAVGVVLGLFILAVLWFSSRSRRNRLLTIWVGAGAACIGLIVMLGRNVQDFRRILTKTVPFLIVEPVRYIGGLLGLICAVRYVRRGYQPRDGAFALIGLSAIVLTMRLSSVQPHGYSIFYTPLAYVAWLIAIYAAAQGLGLRIGRTGWRVFAVAVCVAMISVTADFHIPGRRPAVVAFERGTVRTDPATARVFNELVPFARAAAARSERIVVWPEELAVYFFSNTLAPSRWTILTPGVLPTWEQERYTAELDRQGVKYVVLTDRSTAEYGLALFGSDYNQEVYRWLQDNFHVIREVGTYERTAKDLGGSVAGALIWERTSVANAAGGGERPAPARR